MATAARAFAFARTGLQSLKQFGRTPKAPWQRVATRKVSSLTPERELDMVTKEVATQGRLASTHDQVELGFAQASVVHYATDADMRHLVPSSDGSYYVDLLTRLEGQHRAFKARHLEKLLRDPVIKQLLSPPAGPEYAGYCYDDMMKRIFFEARFLKITGSPLKSSDFPKELKAALNDPANPNLEEIEKIFRSHHVANSERTIDTFKQIADELTDIGMLKPEADNSTVIQALDIDDHAAILEVDKQTKEFVALCTDLGILIEKDLGENEDPFRQIFTEVESTGDTFGESGSFEGTKNTFIELLDRGTQCVTEAKQALTDEERQRTFEANNTGCGSFGTRSFTWLMRQQQEVFYRDQPKMPPIQGNLSRLTVRATLDNFCGFWQKDFDSYAHTPSKQACQALGQMDCIMNEAEKRGILAEMRRLAHIDTGIRPGTDPTDNDWSIDQAFDITEVSFGPNTTNATLYERMFGKPSLQISAVGLLEYSYPALADGTIVKRRLMPAMDAISGEKQQYPLGDILLQSIKPESASDDDLIAAIESVAALGRSGSSLLRLGFVTDTPGAQCAQSLIAQGLADYSLGGMAAVKARPSAPFYWMFAQQAPAADTTFTVKPEIELQANPDAKISNLDHVVVNCTRADVDRIHKVVYPRLEWGPSEELNTEAAAQFDEAISGKNVAMDTAVWRRTKQDASGKLLPNKGGRLSTSTTSPWIAGTSMRSEVFSRTVAVNAPDKDVATHLLDIYLNDTDNPSVFVKPALQRLFQGAAFQRLLELKGIEPIN